MRMTTRSTMLWGAIFAGLGVALGAFGAHALKPLLTVSGRLETYEVAVRYQVYHALALILTGILMRSFQHQKPLALAGLFWVIGTLLFSGSLYLYCFTQLPGIVYATPVGGGFFLAGWGCMLWGLLKK